MAALALTDAFEAAKKGKRAYEAGKKLFHEGQEAYHKGKQVYDEHKHQIHEVEDAAQKVSHAIDSSKGDDHHGSSQHHLSPSHHEESASAAHPKHEQHQHPSSSHSVVSDVQHMQEEGKHAIDAAKNAAGNATASHASTKNPAEPKQSQSVVHVGHGYSAAPQRHGDEEKKTGGAPGLSLYMKAAGRVRDDATHFLATLPQKLMLLKEFLVAMLILLIVVAVLGVMYVFYQYFHPRVCLLNRSAAFDAYIAKHVVDVENHVFHMHRQLSRPSSSNASGDPSVLLLFRVGEKDLPALRCTGGDGNNAGGAPAKTLPPPGASQQCVLKDQEPQMRSALKTLTQNGKDKFHENIKVYYRFYNTLQRLNRPVYSFFASRDILDDPRFNKKDPKTGEPQEVVDHHAVKKFRQEFMDPMDKLRGAIAKVSSEVASWKGLYAQPWYTPQMFDFLTGVHMLNLMLNDYHAQITFSYDTRKSLTYTLQFNVWTLYYVPYADKTFTVRIPNIWKRFPQTFTQQMDLFQQGWKKLGQIIANLPKTLASTKVETFADDDDVPPGHADDEEKEDVVEHLGFLKGLLSIGKFFANILKISIIMIRVVMNFVTDPIGSTIRLILIILGVIVGLVLILIYTLLTLLMVNYLLGFAWAWVVAFGISMFLTVVEVMFVALLTVIFAALWLLDLLTGGMVVRLMRCETLPDEWEHRPNYAQGNTAQRSWGIACCYPCASRFQPWGSALCQRVPSYIPDYCPHQQIITAFRHGNLLGGGYLGSPQFFDTFPIRADPGIVAKDRAAKEKILLDAFARVRSYLGSCYQALQKYDYIDRHICFNVDRLPDSQYPPHVKDKLVTVCSQIYCEYAPRKKHYNTYTADLVGKPADPTNQCLCDHMPKPSPGTTSHTAPNQPAAAQMTHYAHTLFRRALVMFITVLVLLVAVYSLSENASVLFVGGAASSSFG